MRGTRRSGGGPLRDSEGARSHGETRFPVCSVPRFWEVGRHGRAAVPLSPTGVTARSQPPWGFEPGVPRARSRYAARVYRKLRHATGDRRSPSSSLFPTQSTKPVPSPAPSLFANPQRHQYFTSCSHGAKFLLLSGALCCSAPIQDSFPEPHVLSRPDLHPQAVCCPGFVLGFPQPFYQPRRPRLFSSSSLLEQHILPVGELSLGEEIKYFSPVTLTQCGERTAEDRFEPPPEKGKPSCNSLHKTQKSYCLRKRAAVTTQFLRAQQKFPRQLWTHTLGPPSLLAVGHTSAQLSCSSNTILRAASPPSGSTSDREQLRNQDNFEHGLRLDTLILSSGRARTCCPIFGAVAGEDCPSRTSSWPEFP